MRIIGRRSFVKGVAGLTLAGGFPPTWAEMWPTRPVRFIVPLAAGGALGFAARQCSATLSRALAQQVFVENRAGAGGTIGMDAAMKAPSDGYTFLFANDNAAMAPHILKLSYDFFST
jgi:tripartite-type tricarboxylate transporter receptor subunit TctC